MLIRLYSECWMMGLDGLQEKRRRSLIFSRPVWFSLTKKKNTTWLQYFGCFICARTICICCSFIDVSKKFVSTVTGKQYTVKQFITCNTALVVYLITCCECSLQNVGSTTCSLETRARRHLSDVNSLNVSNISVVSLHCVQTHNRRTVSLRIQGTKRVNKPERGGDFVRKLCSRETFWIFLLQTCQPNGINKKVRHWLTQLTQ